MEVLRPLLLYDLKPCEIYEKKTTNMINFELMNKLTNNEIFPLKLFPGLQQAKLPNILTQPMALAKHYQQELVNWQNIKK